MSDYFLGSVALRLLRFDWSHCFGIPDGALADIEFPQCPDEANGSSCTFKLKSVIRGPGEMNLTGGRGQSRPSEAIRRAQRAQLRKIPNRLFAECCLPIRSE